MEKEAPAAVASEVPASKLKDTHSIDWSKAVAVVKKSDTGRSIFFAVRLKERVRVAKGQVIFNGVTDQILTPGSILLHTEADTKREKLTLLREEQFKLEFQQAKDPEAEVEPFPEEDLEKYEPVLEAHVKEELENVFSYHSPNPAQQEKYTRLRAAAKHFAAVVLGNTPKSADQSAAIRKIREAVMTANAAVALEKTQES